MQVCQLSRFSRTVLNIYLLSRIFGVPETDEGTATPNRVSYINMYQRSQVCCTMRSCQLSRIYQDSPEYSPLILNNYLLSRIFGHPRKHGSAAPCEVADCPGFTRTVLNTYLLSHIFGVPETVRMIKEL